MKRFYVSVVFGVIATLLLWLFLPKVEYLPWAQPKLPAEDVATPPVADIPLPKPRPRSKEQPRLIAPECWQPGCDPYLYKGNFNQYQHVHE